jgi:ATP-binding cassette subfamily C protein
LILDEATSALDHQTEKKIQQSLEQLQGTLTILIIAHRETTIAHADKRIYLEKANNSSAPLEVTSDKIKLQQY